MPNAKLLELRQRANLLLRTREELDEIDDDAEATFDDRMRRRREVLDRARREYGPTWDEDGALDALDAADEWQEPGDDTALLASLAMTPAVGAA